MKASRKKKSIILCLNTPKQESQSWLSEIYTIQENVRSAHPFMSSIMWYFEAPTMAGKHQVQAAHWDNPSLLCHYHDYSTKSSEEKNSTLKIISSCIFSPNSSAATTFQPDVCSLVRKRRPPQCGRALRRALRPFRGYPSIYS